VVVSFSGFFVDVVRKRKGLSTAVSSPSFADAEISQQESSRRRRQQEWEIYKRRLMAGRRKEAEERRRKFQEEDRHTRTIQMDAVDEMTGIQFEKYVTRLLEHRGYRVRHTGRSGDNGVDMIVEKVEQKHAVQVKRQKFPVSRRAVSDAVAGKALHHCTGAMVITNNMFTSGAQKLAEANACILINRKVLAEWILDFQQ
jgi:HJR/Mrr/RecB family endonuclease